MGRIPAAWAIDDVHEQVVPAELAPIAEWFEREPDARERFRWALRDSLDELLDGQRTGRWAYQHLSKTEKTYLGTAVEVNLTKEFEFANGDDLDWQVAGWTSTASSPRISAAGRSPWRCTCATTMTRARARPNHPALLTWLNDDTSQWAAGLITITDERLRWRVDKESGERSRGYNRDNKRRLADSREVGHLLAVGRDAA